MARPKAVPAGERAIRGTPGWHRCRRVNRVPIREPSVPSRRAAQWTIRSAVSSGSPAPSCSEVRSVRRGLGPTSPSSSAAPSCWPRFCLWPRRTSGWTLARGAGQVRSPGGSVAGVSPNNRNVPLAVHGGGRVPAGAHPAPGWAGATGPIFHPAARAHPPEPSVGRWPSIPASTPPCSLARPVFDYAKYSASFEYSHYNWSSLPVSVPDEVRRPRVRQFEFRPRRVRR